MSKAQSIYNIITKSKESPSDEYKDIDIDNWPKYLKSEHKKTCHTRKMHLDNMPAMVSITDAADYLKFHQEDVVEQELFSIMYPAYDVKFDDNGMPIFTTPDFSFEDLKTETIISRVIIDRVKNKIGNKYPDLCQIQYAIGIKKSIDSIDDLDYIKVSLYYPKLKLVIDIDECPNKLAKNDALNTIKDALFKSLNISRVCIKIYEVYDYAKSKDITIHEALYNSEIFAKTFNNIDTIISDNVSNIVSEFNSDTLEDSYNKGR